MLPSNSRNFRIRLAIYYEVLGSDDLCNRVGTEAAAAMKPGLDEKGGTIIHPGVDLQNYQSMLIFHVRSSLGWASKKMQSTAIRCVL